MGNSVHVVVSTVGDIQKERDTRESGGRLNLACYFGVII